MFKHCYLVYLGAQWDKFDSDLIASLGFWSIIIKELKKSSRF